MMRPVERNFDVFADFHQFLVRDAAANWDHLADQWSAEAVDDMYVQGEGYIAVGTARNMPVPVTVRIVDLLREPEGTWDRSRNGTLRIMSGELVVEGVTDNGASGGRLRVPVGDYAVRVLYGGLETLSQDGVEGDDRYVVELAPSLSL